MLGDLVHATPRHAADRGLGRKSDLEPVVVPGVAESVVLARALQERGYVVVRILKPSLERLELARGVVATVLSHQAHRTRPSRPHRITTWTADRQSKREYLSGLD